MPKKVYFSPERSMSPGASSKAIADGRLFAARMGFAVVSPRSANRASYYFSLFRTWMTSDVFLAMYPYFGSPMARSNPTRTVDRFLMPALGRLRGRTKSILYVVDFPLEQIFTPEDEALVDRAAVETEKTLFTESDILIVFNSRMKDRIIQRYGVAAEKIVEFEILDCELDLDPQPTRRLADTRTIAFAAGSARKDYLTSWFKEVPQSKHTRWEFFGSDGEWIRSYGREDMTYHGFQDERGLGGLLSARADFGIISGKVDAKLDSYQNYGSSSKFGLFVASGVPVLVASRYEYICELVKKYRVGWVFDSPRVLPSLAEGITPKEYDEVRARVLDLGNKIRSGHFFKRAVNEAITKIGFGSGN